ncbi:YwqH-like family protein [Butyrivibrio proteoclasticus]|uniref:YwqH-like family protein n=1 Tax=Butyrivibrio proteoclasticus TaxID=43305 RepID=UPI00047BDD3E|nr:DUF5082 family protein [Butyrivibrio proteoclasticus]
MGKIEEILKLIREAEAKIAEYKEQIMELEEAASYVKREYNSIEENVFEYTTSYDMSCSERWRGNTLIDAEELSGVCADKVEDAQGSTRQFLDDIYRCIELLEQKIYDCQLYVQNLEGQLNCA